MNIIMIIPLFLLISLFFAGYEFFLTQKKKEILLLKKAFSYTINWNIEAVGLCAKHREYPERVENIIDTILHIFDNGNRPTVVLTEVNTSIANNPRLLNGLKKLNLGVDFATKGEHCAKPVEEDPDGILFIYPKEKFVDLKVEVKPHAIATHEEKGKMKTSGAPYIKISSPLGYFVALVHLKSKTNNTQVRFDQLVDGKIFTESGKVNSKLVGAFGDFNESLSNKDETLVLDTFRKAGMNNEMEHWDFSNMKESKVLKDEIYNNDSRKVNEQGMALTTTDWGFFRGGNITGRCAGYPSNPAQWYDMYYSDHRPVFIEIH